MQPFPFSIRRPGSHTAGRVGVRVPGACAILLVVLSVPSAPRAQAPPALQELTSAVVSLAGELQSAPVSQRAVIKAQLKAALLARRQQLAAAMDKAPSDVLQFAIPGDVRAAIPVDLQPLVEQRVRVTGRAEVAIEDGPNYSRVHDALLVAGKRLALRFADVAPPEFTTGAIVQVEGVQVGEALTTTSSSTTTTATTTSSTGTTILPGTFGGQKTLVVLVNFQDSPTQPYTAADAENVVFTTASSFWMENSIQQTWLTGDVAGWFTIPLSSTTCNTASIQSYANQAAANAGYTLSNYARFVYAFPYTSACPWSGYSYIGGTPSTSWINQSPMTQQIVNHELGHALGLYHSHSLSCGTAVLASSGCTQYEYGDYYDTMASSSVNGYSMDYNAFQRERLGWLNNGAQPPVTTVLSTGTYTISPFEAQDTNPKALKIPQSSGTGAYYYVEARQPIGFDQYLSLNVAGYSNVRNGVVVHLATPGSGNSSDLLDMNPATAWGSAMALDVGQSYTDPSAGVTIAPVSVGGTGATVQVTFAASACTPSNPALSISTLPSSVAAGTTASFNVSVTSKDSAGCAPSLFNLAAAVPSGWTAAYSAPSLTLAPGASATVSLAVTSSGTTPNGTYSVGASAANASVPPFTASATGTETIYTAPATNVSVGTSAATYTLGQTVTATVTVLTAGSGAGGVGIVVTLTRPNGTTVVLTGTTTSKGIATVTYKLRKQDPKGTWQVTAAAGTTSASTTFAVQ